MRQFEGSPNRAPAYLFESIPNCNSAELISTISFKKIKHFFRRHTTEDSRHSRFFLSSCLVRREKRRLHESGPAFGCHRPGNNAGNCGSSFTKRIRIRPCAWSSASSLLRHVVSTCGDQSEPGRPDCLILRTQAKSLDREIRTLDDGIQEYRLLGRPHGGLETARHAHGKPRRKTG